MGNKARGGHSIRDIVAHAHGSREVSVPVRGQMLGRLKAHTVELGRSGIAKDGRRGELFNRGLDGTVAEGAGKGRDGQAGGGRGVVEGGASIEPVLLGGNSVSQQNFVSRIRAMLHLHGRVSLERQIGTRNAAGSMSRMRPGSGGRERTLGRTVHEMAVGLGTREVVGARQGRLRVVRVRGRRRAGGVQGWALVHDQIEVDTGK